MLYDVTTMEVGTRYIGETPVECVIFVRRDGTVVVVRLTPEQQDHLSDLLRFRRVARAVS